MKKYVILSLVFFYTAINAQVTQGKVTYRIQKIKKVFAKEQKKHLSTERLNKFSKFENKIIAAEKKAVLNLRFVNQTSIFNAQKALNKGNNRFTKVAVGPYGLAVFYNSAEERLCKLNAFGQEFLISKQKYKWVVTKEKKKIGNYVCYKATTIEKVKTRNGIKKHLVTAWFTPQINVPFGPLGYSGLPGLILELEARNYKYYTTKIKLNPKEEIKITKPTKGKKVTQEEFYDIAIGTMKDLRKRKGF